MTTDITVVNDNIALNREYSLAKDKLNISLRLYRLAIIYGASSEDLVRYNNVVQCQIIFENIYAQLPSKCNEK